MFGALGEEEQLLVQIQGGIWRFPKMGGTPNWLVYTGKSQLNFTYLGVLLFQETTILDKNGGTLGSSVGHKYGEIPKIVQNALASCEIQHSTTIWVWGLVKMTVTNPVEISTMERLAVRPVYHQNAGPFCRKRLSSAQPFCSMC